MTALDLGDIEPGLNDLVFDAQRVFRVVMNAMAHPGRVADLDSLPSPPAPLNRIASAISLSLLDFDTPVWLDTSTSSAAISYMRFHTGCLMVEHPETAQFVIITDPAAMPPLSRLQIGTNDRPDRSATVLLQVADLSENGGWRLSGPGIDGTQRLSIDVPGIDLRPIFQENQRLFPCGVDTILCARRRLTAIPRTTRIEE